jgi:hypothetical protein
MSLPSRRVFVRLFLTGALVAFALGIWQVADRRRFLREAEKTVGTVVRLEKTSSVSNLKRSTSQVVYRAVVSYRTSAGQIAEFRDQVSSRPARFEVGDTVDVWYRPSNPRQAIVYRSWWSVWFGAVIGLGLGVLFTVCAFLGDVMLRTAARNLEQSAKTDRRYN